MKDTLGVLTEKLKITNNILGLKMTLKTINSSLHGTEKCAITMNSKDVFVGSKTSCIAFLDGMKLYYEHVSSLGYVQKNQNMLNNNALPSSKNPVVAYLASRDKGYKMHIELKRMTKDEYFCQHGRVFVFSLVGVREDMLTLNGSAVTYSPNGLPIADSDSGMFTIELPMARYTDISKMQVLLRDSALELERKIFGHHVANLGAGESLNIRDFVFEHTNLFELARCTNPGAKTTGLKLMTASY